MRLWQLFVMIVCAVMVAARSPPGKPPVPPKIEPSVDQSAGNTGLSGLPVDNFPACRQPKTAGPCDESLTRYFYNIKTFRCEQFEYSGCWGNDNNFETIDECVSKCLLWKDGDEKLPHGGVLDKLFPEDYFRR